MGAAVSKGYARLHVTFKHAGAHIASSRYRAIIPARELAKLGIEPGAQILVIGKHGWDWSEQTSVYKRVVFDVCDSHWKDQHEAHYRLACSQADAVTCNSLAMQAEIKRETGRDAWVIPDPYEQPECEARCHKSLLWFGHPSNLKDLAGYTLPNLRVVTNTRILKGPIPENAVDWSPQTMNAEFDRAGLVILPAGDRQSKSANRAIESLRRGLMPVCGPMPAYADLGVWIGDIRQGVDWCLSRPAEVVKRIKASQAYIREEYSPARIASQWLTVLESL